MRKVPKRITVRMLKRMGACRIGIVEFRRAFGESAAFVPGNVYAAMDHWQLAGLLWWFLEHLDPDEFRATGDAFRSQKALENSPRWFRAAALCRLARQNVRRKQVRP